MKLKARVDRNQKEIVEHLREIGASVLVMAALGHGAPDLVVGYKSKNYLFEIKDGMKPPSAQKLTPDEQKFHDSWRGTIRIVHSWEDALAVLKIFV